jgi:hypothetical protein
MLNLNKFYGKSSYFASLSELNGVVAHFGVKLRVGDRASLYLTDTCVGVVEGVNVERNVSHEQRHHAARMVEVAMSNNDIANLSKGKAGAIQRTSKLKSAACIDE